MVTKQGDIRYSSKKDLRGKFTQQGTFAFQNTIKRPHQSQLRLYERMWRQDLTIKSAIQARIQWLISTIGAIEHPDKNVAQFLNYNIKQLEDLNGRSWTNILEVMLQTMYWSGYSDSEILFQLKDGTLYLEDIVTYHPSTIMIVTDKKGKLTHNLASFNGYYKSGIHQLSSSPEFQHKHLDLWKMIHLNNEADYGNYYGRSLIGASYKWYRLKEALIDMMASALDRLGTKLTWVRMPSYKTEELRVDPQTGEELPITSLQLVMEQFENADGPPDVLFLPFQQSELKPEIGTESLQDQIGDLYIKAIEYADHQSVKHIIPSFLLSSTQYLSSASQGGEIQNERQIELFMNSIEADRNLLLTTLIKKVFMPIMSWNFSSSSTKVAPTFSRVYSDRSEDRLATMQMIKGLVESAVLNPRSDEDYTKIMQMLRLGIRERTDDDKKFIEEMLIAPRKKDPRPSDVGPKGSGRPGRSTGNKSKQISKKAPKTSGRSGLSKK